MASPDSRQRILLPVNPLFISATLVTALTFNLLPWRSIAGLPDLLALVLVFWSVREPRRVSVGTAWLLGIIMDVGNGALLGLVHLMLPRARITHVSRDALDTCVSCFAQRFAANSSAFAYDLCELGRRYRHYAAIMDH